MFLNRHFYKNNQKWLKVLGKKPNNTYLHKFQRQRLHLMQWWSCFLLPLYISKSSTHESMAKRSICQN